MDKSTVPELPEYLKEQIDDAEHIFNVLCLVYNERHHDAFLAAVERLLEHKYECVVLDASDYNVLNSEAADASDYWRELEKIRGEADSLRDELRSAARQMRELADAIEP